jgi:crotonobetaine/carnitine-CoA ligase
MNIRELIENRAQDIPDRIFLFYKDEKISYIEFDREVNRSANMLLSLGVKKEDKVCLLLPNCKEFIFIWFALAKVGGIMVPINIHLKGEGLEYIINHSDAETLIVHPELFNSVAPIENRFKNIRNKLILYEEKGNFISFSKLLKDFHSDPPPYFEIKPEDVMSIIYTSGTTGLPKGVMLSQNSYINTGREFVDFMIRANEEDILYTSLPLFHCNAQQLTTMGTIIKGISMALSERFSASEFWNEVRKYNATIFNYIGAMLTILYKQPKRDDDGNNPARLTFGGAAPKEIWVDFERRFNLTILEGYGLTETATVALCNPLDNIKVGSIGKPLPHTDVKVVNERDEDIKPYEYGEIVIKEMLPHTIMEGYYKMPDKTEEAMRNGWFHSGDRGMIDEDGYLYFLDRIKDCIRRRGENISSYEIEKILNSHPAILESAAIGVPSELGEEDVKVYIVLKVGKSLTPEEIIDYCEDRMAYFMIPRYIEFRDSLPKTPTERVQKFELRKEGIGNSWDRERAGYRLRR